MDDGNTLHGMELALSISTFPVRQQSFYPTIIGRNNGVVNLFKTTQQAARRREELSNNLITTRGHRPRRILPLHVKSPAIPGTPLPPPSSLCRHEVVRACWEYNSVYACRWKKQILY